MVRGCASGKYRTRKGPSFPFLQQFRGRTNGMSRTFDRTERMQHRAVKLTPRQIQTSSILIFIAIPSDQIRLDGWAVHSTSVLDIPRIMPANAVGSRLVGLYHQQRHRTSIMPIAQRRVDAVSVPTLRPPTIDSKLRLFSGRIPNHGLAVRKQESAPLVTWAKENLARIVWSDQSPVVSSDFF